MKVSTIFTLAALAASTIAVPQVKSGKSLEERQFAPPCPAPQCDGVSDFYNSGCSFIKVLGQVKTDQDSVSYSPAALSGSRTMRHRAATDASLEWNVATR